jgi:putative hydrolase of the HAD superfamily
VKVRTVTVDFWGTLVLESPGSDDRYQGPRLNAMRLILRDNGLHFTPAQLTRAYEDSAEFLRKIWSERRDVGVVEHVTTILRSLDETLPVRIATDVMAALVDAYARPLLLVLPTADPGARAALMHLREAGMALVIVSNTMRTPGVILRQVLTRLHLLDCFHETFFSDELGVRKPDPAIFMTALRAVGGEPGTAVHVGDDPILDVQGARAAGLRSIQIVGTGGGVAPAAERPDRAIAGFEELPAAIAALETG